MSTFGGFTQKQMELIARDMGFDGPMDKFNEFLAASPDKASLLSRYTDKAKSLVEKPLEMAKGGMVYKSDKTKNKLWKDKQREILARKVSSTPENISTKNYPNNDEITKTLINDPGKLATKAETSNIKLEKNQLINSKNSQVKTPEEVKATDVGKTATADNVTQPKTVTEDATLIGKDVDKVIDETKAAQGTVSENAQAKAAQAQPSENATVLGQLNKILSTFDGENLPPWAAGAQRMVNSVMNSRGIGASSIAASASTQALMESTLQIAVQDAATYSAFEMKNLDNRQQAALQNAQSFLQMDLANLENEQQTTLFKTQTKVQTMLSDQAADNAMKQFNATSKNQANQFFASLKSQISQFNATQINGMKQFKASQADTISMFNAQMKSQTDQFNAENRLIIDQANAKWRQTITTTNNAEANENNRLNAQQLTGLTTAAYNNLWQRERDLMSFAFTASENAENRAMQVVLQKIAGKTAKKVAAMGKPDEGNPFAEAAGGFVSKLVFG